MQKVLLASLLGTKKGRICHILTGYSWYSSALHGLKLLLVECIAGSGYDFVIFSVVPYGK